MKAGQNITHTEEYIQRRFWSKVAVTQDTTKCWLWMHGRFKSGYGQFSFKLKPVYAHRLAYVFFHKLPLEAIAEWYILHQCDNPPCCNPYHLMQGTPKLNTEHISLRGNPKYQKVSRDQVRYIRQQAYYRTHTSIAEELHVHHSTVALIVQRKTHRLVPD